MDSREVILRLSGIDKVFEAADGGGKRALNPVDLTVGKGQFVSLVGPSGCGKTTLLKIIAGLIPPSSGDLEFGGEHGRIAPRHFGMAFQSAALLPWRTILQNVMLPADVMRMPKETARQRAKELLALMRLEGVNDQYPNELSGGMLQRAAIARAMLHDPEMLLMDEPFGALDAMTREQLNEELQQLQLQQGKTVVFVTHGIQEAVFLSDRVIVFSGTPGSLVADIAIPLARPRSPSDRTSNEARGCEAEIRKHLESVSSTGR